ncbi:ribosomal-protein-alanine N-acetyltransferase [Mobilisporobacter senegalensis]|uniref:Ribosomal-protein-alanine N-acetyltransferase n=1 Tax=Mobilisporobacter senegalensis TaxID=1329262 RepID=A0A3N1XI58_9FIRM|nr:GNAT family protein [Mobilisporobacter senegalensis]ROR25768.1 ribosomal-protein-alanine N-acetyltransferase [Mobilisporobacter senegalensis]
MKNNYKELLYDNETIKAKNILLRRFKKEDDKDVFEYGSDEKALKYLIWDGLKTLDDAKSVIIDYYWSRPGIYAIELKKNKKCIGCIDLRLEPEHEKASFGYVLNRDYWGKGYMTEALFTVLSLCFDKLELNRVESTHYIGNEGSGKVMKKCGMEFEGIGKQEVKIKGVFHDVAHYAITRNTWSENLLK